MEDNLKGSATTYLLEEQNYHSYGIHSPNSPQRQNVMNAVKLQPNVSKLNFVCGMMHYGLIAFSFAISMTLQPFLILSSSYYNINQNHAGMLITLIVAIQIIMKLCLSGLYRSCTEKFGRKVVVFYGSISLLLGFLMLPLEKSIFPGLIISNLLLSNGNAAISIIPLFADYTTDESKARAAGFSTFFMGIAAVLANIFLKILLYANAGLNTCCIVIGAVVFVALIVNCFGLTERSLHDQYRPVPPQEEGTEITESQDHSISEAIRTFKTNGWALIALVLQVLGSSDFFILFTFVTLYIKSKFTPGDDHSPQNEDIIVNNIQTIIFVPALLFNLMHGYFINKQTRAFCSAVCILLGGIAAFILLSVAQKPDDGYIIAGAILLGATIPGFNVIAGYLGVRSFPPGLRTIMVGLMGLVAILAYLISAIVGGLLYEYWRPDGIFIIGAIVFGVSLIVISIIYKTMDSGQKAYNTDSMYINNV